MNQLDNLPISRCIQPVEFGKIKSVLFITFLMLQRTDMVNVVISDWLTLIIEFVVGKI